MSSHTRRAPACAVALLLALGSAAIESALAAPASEVPDALTRKSGLRLVPMAPAAQTYARQCQGCHGEAGISVPEIPQLAGRVGYFVRIPEGRRYLVQVPNVALNPASDAQIADLLNWVLTRFSAAQLPPDFEPYTPEEVSKWRRERIDDPRERRTMVLALLADAGAAAGTMALRAPGREKFVQCASCHGADGRSTVIGKYPKIGGQNREYLVGALKAYKEGRRQGSYAAVMAEVARQLSDEDIAALAAYIETLAP
jgi:cytochrome c553